MVVYAERVWPRWNWFVGALLEIPAVTLVFAPINLGIAPFIGVAVYLATISAFFALSPKISLTDTEFFAGRARIARAYLGKARPLVGAEARAALGPGLDARAWILLRAWVPDLVRIEITDTRDATPYWLVSTRRPEQLARAINASN